MEKLDLILPYVMTTVTLIIITVIITHLFNFHLKKRIIQSGPIDENAVKFLYTSAGPAHENLKWGLLFLMGGLGLVVIQFTPFTIDAPITYGIESIFLAAGFFLYYLIVRKKKKYQKP